MTAQDPRQTIEAARSLLSAPLDVEEIQRGMTAIIDQLESWVAQSDHAARAPAPQSRLASVGLLASGIAHDFNNLLTVIRMSAELLEALPADSPQRANLIRDIQATADRGGALTTQILSFAQREPSALQAVELGGLIEELAPMLDRLLGEEIAWIHERTEDALWIGSGPGQLEQVIINLVMNARDAIKGEGSVRLHARAVSQAEVLLEVADTGHGMDTEVAARVFEPFFTTKGAAHGTGLGLANVKAIIDHLGGRVTVESAPGAGTTFSITLPRSPAPVDPQA